MVCLAMSRPRRAAPFALVSGCQPLPQSLIEASNTHEGPLCGAGQISPLARWLTRRYRAEGAAWSGALAPEMWLYCRGKRVFTQILRNLRANKKRA